MVTNYKASKTITRFHKCDDLVRLLLGPFGSGKSVGCVMDLMMRASNQKPDIYGNRNTKWAIIRNTYRELSDTTMKTFFLWVPKHIGEWSEKNMTFTFTKKLPDGTTLNAEFLFRALDKPDDAKKLLSLDLTGAWVNELKELPLEIFAPLIGRCGRYPLMSLGGPSWYGVIADTNPPDMDHWIYKMFEEERPEKHTIFKQPSGLSDEAENVENLPEGYYRNMTYGRDKEWINVFVHGNYGFIMDGKPIYPEYKDDIHFDDDLIELNPKLTLYIGLDFGLTPAAAIGQISPTGRLELVDELVWEGGAKNFCKALKQKLNTEYRGFDKIEVWGDPSGDERVQTDEKTPFMILEEEGIVAYPTYTNDYIIRREVMAERMQVLDFSGRPAFAVGPKAKTIRKGLSGGYKYKRMQVSGEARYMDKPNKNKYSHICEAAQYLALGALGDDRIVGGFGKQNIDYSKQERGIR